jgi:hypothetical protein
MGIKLSAAKLFDSIVNGTAASEDADDVDKDELENIS